MEIIPKLFYARREFKKSFQTEISAAVPEQSFHAIVNLHVKEINPSSSFDAKSLSFCFQEFCILIEILSKQIFVQNWRDNVCQDMELQGPYIFWGKTTSYHLTYRKLSGTLTRRSRRDLMTL